MREEKKSARESGTDGQYLNQSTYGTGVYGLFVSGTK